MNTACPHATGCTAPNRARLLQRKRVRFTVSCVAESRPKSQATVEKEIATGCGTFSLQKSLLPDFPVSPQGKKPPPPDFSKHPKFSFGLRIPCGNFNQTAIFSLAGECQGVGRGTRKI